MVQALDSTNYAPTNKIKHSTLGNRAKSDKITFGFYERMTYSSDLAHFTEELYKLRKQRRFFKIFPFLNPEPKITTIKETKHIERKKLSGEEEIEALDKEKLVKTLRKQCDRLHKRIYGK